ncbi:hypothetical protein SS50377_24390 [Spironucleus salmonicida]|uniref:FERM central domain-containing protein n=1 Tax=Spironucleus salmonicida TaxID=348837 RepID=V6LN57_9EUKA|nr:hypothetical protein SS50377_24390 [Spironucleus salmonicida]|eukprot:EST46060.1 hypothetical protein SS50377_14050 [Spironucleus salmonicida]
MHLKIYLPTSYITIPTSSDHTVSDIVKFILTKQEVPLKYAPLCTILEVRSDNFGYALKHIDKPSTSSQLHFRILAIQLSTPKLDQNFAEILQNQINRLIITRTWITSDEISAKLAAFRCGIDFGKIQESHKNLFLDNILQQYFSADMISNFKVKDLVKNLIGNWQIITQGGMCDTREKAIQNYLEACQSSVRAYGCACFLGKLKKVAEEESDVVVYIGICQNGIIMLNGDGNELGNIKFDELKIEYEVDDPRGIKIISNGENGLLSYQINMGGVGAMKSVLDFIQNAQMGE